MKKIIIIEDNKDLQEIYKISFEKKGYNVMLANNGLDGISKTVDYRPDIILLDIMMPDMNGVEFLKTLNNNTSQNYPIVVATNITDNSIIEECMKLGAKAVLLKSDYTGSQIVEKVGLFLKD